ncbi:MAG: zinc-ribbon domain-containing protein [Negativicutes bacterium]|nr:zinc-ribbon domain-containing protein [Negativicutes bacterium]
MAFFDRLSKAAKNVTNRGADMVEVTRLNAKISNDKSAIEAVKTRIGDFYWKKFEEGAPLDDDVAKMCLEIKEIQKSITALQEEIEAINARQEKEEEAVESVSKCPNCGAAVAAGAKFCGVCGTKIEMKPPEPAQDTEPDILICGACGAENPLGMKFCGECGNKLS